MKKFLLSGIIALSLFGFNSISNTNPNNSITGKVIKAYTARGFGRMGNDWLFMDVQTKNGTIKVAIAPTFKISNLPINEGDEVRVSGFTPLRFPNGVVKAFDIYDVTQKRDYPISGCERGYYGR